jgi:NAD(P)-dependent dehydrogenase (short-subunit alcohol dehydrogenase family)
MTDAATNSHPSRPTDPSRSLAGRRALVTGAGSGIGRAAAETLARAGAQVIVQDIDATRVETVVASLKSEGLAAEPGACDVGDEAALKRLVAAGAPVTLLVNNAGIGAPERTIEAIDRAAWQLMFETHVWGALAATRACVAGMKAERFGRIVNIASNRGQVGWHDGSQYNAAKSALIGFAKSWARELAPHEILVNAIAPGVVRTAMTLRHGEQAIQDEADLNLLKRAAEPSEIAAWIKFLFEPTGNFTTGQLLCPNGGDPIVGI